MCVAEKDGATSVSSFHHETQDNVHGDPESNQNDQEDAKEVDQFE
jgi:hypothetical protein